MVHVGWLLYGISIILETIDLWFLVDVCTVLIVNVDVVGVGG